MSLLAVSVQYYGTVRLVGAVKAGAFWPRPEVDSAMIRIDVERRASTDDTDFTDEDSLQSVSSVKSVDSSASEAAFFRVVRAGFGEKRKQLKNNLRRLGLNDEAIAAALEGTGIDGRRRAETLDIEEWENLVSTLGAHLP